MTAKSKITPIKATPQFFRMMTRYRSAIDQISDEAAGQTLKALLALAESGECVPPVDPSARLALEFIRPDVIAARDRAAEISAVRRQACNTRWKR